MKPKPEAEERLGKSNRHKADRTDNKIGSVRYYGNEKFRHGSAWIHKKLWMLAKSFHHSSQLLSSFERYARQHNEVQVHMTKEVSSSLLPRTLPWQQHCEQTIFRGFFFQLILAMAEELKKQGLFVDDSYILRVLEPNVAKDTQDLKEENEVFLESNFSPLFYAEVFKCSQLSYFRRADRFP